MDENNTFQIHLQKLAHQDEKKPLKRSTPWVMVTLVSVRPTRCRAITAIIPASQDCL